MNKPSALTCSMSDIENFGMRFDLKTLTAVGNNGSSISTEKTASCDPAGFSKALMAEQISLQKLQTPEAYAAEINRFLGEADKYGIEFIAGG